MLLYHICQQNEWNSRKGSEWFPDSFPKIGFIHLSFDYQIKETLQLHFKYQKELVCLEIDIPENDKNLKFEAVPGRNHNMPHYYGSIKLNWVRNVLEIKSKD